MGRPGASKRSGQARGSVSLGIRPDFGKINLSETDVELLAVEADLKRSPVQMDLDRTIAKPGGYVRIPVDRDR